MTLEVMFPWTYDNRNKTWHREFESGHVSKIQSADREDGQRVFVWHVAHQEWGEIETTEATFVDACEATEKFVVEFEKDREKSATEQLEKAGKS